MALLAALALVAGAADAARPEPGAPGSERGLAVRTRKALVVPPEGPQVVDNAVLLVSDGRIQAVGPAATTAIPEGYEVLDVGDDWIMPGMVGLHCHTASRSFFFVNDLNDGVYLTNPGLRAYTSVVPGNTYLQRAVAGGVTSVLYIPGSATNIGGWGVLLKTGFDTYERMEIRNPGSLKLAQSGNPESWATTVGRSFMNWNTRRTFERGLAYARRWQAYQDGGGAEPERDIDLDVFRYLLDGRTQVSAHTQIYQIVLETITMVSEELGLDVYIDHGSFDGWRAAALAARDGVSAILGPREVTTTISGRHPLIGPLDVDTDGKVLGMAAKYQEAGHTMIGFNTDSPVVPQEELSLQAGVAVRYGLRIDNLEHVRGLTIVPAMTARIDDRVGSLQAGKDADFLVLDGDPADPRTTVKMTFIEGERVYDNQRDERRW